MNRHLIPQPRTVIRLDCDGTNCGCVKHLDDPIPVCPYHRVPLHYSEEGPGRGECRNCRLSNTPRVKGVIGGMNTRDGAKVLYTFRDPRTTGTYETWIWREREDFDRRDLPPFSGHEPVELKEN